MHDCMHTYIHTYIHTCIRTHIHTYIYTYIHTYIHIQTNAHIQQTQLHVHTHLRETLTRGRTRTSTLRRGRRRRCSRERRRWPADKFNPPTAESTTEDLDLYVHRLSGPGRPRPSPTGDSAPDPTLRINGRPSKPERRSLRQRQAMLISQLSVAQRLGTGAVSDCHRGEIGSYAYHFQNDTNRTSLLISSNLI